MEESRTQTDDWLDALFGEEVEEPSPLGGTEEPAEMRDVTQTMTRKTFLMRLIGRQ